MNFVSGGKETQLQVSGGIGRQEEWERVRKALKEEEEAAKKVSSEPVDARPLYVRLQEQRDRKQEEFEEKLKFKNMIYKGTDEDEYKFLTEVQEQEEEAEIRRWEEEAEEIKKYRARLASLESTAPATLELKPKADKHKEPPSKPASHISKLQALVKKKTDNKEDSSSSKKRKADELQETKQEIVSTENTKTGSKSEAAAEPKRAKIDAPVGLGLVDYGSDEESS
eukprot:Colp12_sorted_trinity150504_noHs@19599